MCGRCFTASQGPDVIAILLFGKERKLKLIKRNSSSEKRGHCQGETLIPTLRRMSSDGEGDEGPGPPGPRGSARATGGTVGSKAWRKEVRESTCWAVSRPGPLGPLGTLSALSHLGILRGLLQPLAPFHTSALQGGSGTWSDLSLHTRWAALFPRTDADALAPTACGCDLICKQGLCRRSEGEVIRVGPSPM